MRRGVRRPLVALVVLVLLLVIGYTVKAVDGRSAPVPSRSAGLPHGAAATAHT